MPGFATSSLRGTWFDRTAERAARQRGETFDKYAYATVYEIRLSPLPCWEDLPEEKWRGRVTEIVDEIEKTEATNRILEGKKVVGPAKVKKRSPRHIPDEVKKSPSPMVLAATSAGYKALRRAFDTFSELFWEQSERFLSEPDADVQFPPLSFPPARPMTDGPALDLDLDRAFEPG